MECDICYQELTTIKCKTCTCNLCEACIIKINEICPICKKQFRDPIYTCFFTDELLLRKNRNFFKFKKFEISFYEFLKIDKIEYIIKRKILDTLLKYNINIMLKLVLHSIRVPQWDDIEYFFTSQISPYYIITFKVFINADKCDNVNIIISHDISKESPT